jgi:hypothetical protein
MAAMPAPTRFPARTPAAVRSFVARNAGIVAITVAAAVLRLSTLDVQSYWFDESVTVIDILDPGLWSTMKAVVFEDITPPLYFLLAWLWTQPFGEGEVALRSLSALIGAATVPVAYLLGVRLASRRAGLILAALVAVSPLMVWFAQEGRAYALAIFLTAVSLLLWLRVLEERSRRALVLWAAAAALALLSHYFAAFAVAAQCVWLLVATRLRRDVFVACAGLGALVLAMLPMIAEQTSDGDADWVARFTSLGTRLEEVPERFVLGPPEVLGGGSFHPLTAVVLALVVALFVRADDAHRRAAVRAGAVGLAAIALPLVAGVLGADFFLYRYVVVAWIPLAAAVAVLLASPRLGRVGPVAAGIACALLLATTGVSVADPDLRREDWRTMSELVGPPTVDRAVAIGDWFERQPLMAYGHTFYAVPPEGFRVRELVVVGKPHLWVRGWHETPRFDPPPPGFELVEQRRIRTGLSLLRFRSDTPRRITASSFWATNRIPDEAVVVEVAPR